VQPPDFYATMWTAIRDPKKARWKGELVNRAKDGTLVPVLLTITPYRNKEGVVAGYMGIAVDMTQVKEMEAKVAHQDRLASIGTLASGLAHEIGTPLGVVRGRAEFLMMKSESPEAQRELGVITTQIDRISKLIRSLLRISRSFSDVSVTSISPREVAEEVLSLVGQGFRDGGAEVVLDISPDIRILGDSSRLEQVFLNLAVNSQHAIAKAREEGRTSRHFFRIECTKVGDRVQVVVTDSGCGVAPENLKKLFRPFFTTKEVGKGTGLGLAIVSQLLTEMGAQVSVKSELDVGTSFTLDFAVG
jgi:signal transduction histidine kinase